MLSDLSLFGVLRLQPYGIACAAALLATWYTTPASNQGVRLVSKLVLLILAAKLGHLAALPNGRLLEPGLMLGAGLAAWDVVGNTRLERRQSMFWAGALSLGAWASAGATLELWMAAAAVMLFVVAVKFAAEAWIVPVWLALELAAHSHRGGTQPGLVVGIAVIIVVLAARYLRYGVSKVRSRTV